MKIHLCNHQGRRSSEKGISTVFLGLIFFSFLAFLGFAVDTANVHRTKEQLQAAVDNMALRLVYQIEDQDLRRLGEIAEQGIRDNLNAKGLTDYTLSEPNIVLTPEAAPRQVNLSASVTVPLRILGIVPYFAKTTVVSASAQALSKRLVTVILADISNSMNSPAEEGCSGAGCVSKLQKMREGLIQFINVIDPKPEDYLGIVTFGGAEAEIFYELQRDVDKAEVNRLILEDMDSTSAGTPTWHAFRLAREELVRVAAETSILPTDTVNVVVYSDGRPVGNPASQVSLPYPCTSFQYDNTYPVPPMEAPSTTEAHWLQRLTNASHLQLATIHEADLTRQAVHGVKILALSIGQIGVSVPDFNCDRSDDTHGEGNLTRKIGDPFECVNNMGMMLQITLMARVAKDLEYFTSDIDPTQDGIQTPPSYPSCLPANTAIVGPVGDSANFQNSDQLNAFLLNYGQSIKAALMM